jgi:hypothetical protein
LGHGVAAQVEYLKTSQSNVSSLDPSVVYGNGSFGIGGAISRTGTSLSDSASGTDLAEVGMGFAIKDRLTLGVDFSRVLSANRPDAGVLGATMTWNGAGRQGFSIGLGLTSEIQAIGAAAQTGTFALGYSFMGGSNLEGGIILNNLASTGNYTLTADYTYGGQVVYLGLGYRYVKVLAQHRGLGRIGFILSKAIDFSVICSTALQSNSDITYGASLRVLF